MTDALASLLAPNGSPSELLTGSVLSANVTQAKVNTSAEAIKTAIANILSDAGLSASSFNLISTPFAADRTGADRVLEIVKVQRTGQGISLTSRVAADDGFGSASVQLTASSTAATAQQLPPPAAGTVLGQQDHFAALAEACLADPPSIRAPSIDSGVPTTLSAACGAMPFANSYKFGGYTFKQRYATLLTSDDFTGAKFSRPERVFTYPDGKIFFKMAYKTTSGYGGMVVDVAEKTNPAGKAYGWEVVGNQRDYDSAIEARLDNYNQLNPNNTLESAKSQYKVGLRLFFNPLNASGRLVQAVRIKGPGLSANGVVMHRSSVCGTNDYMTITNKTGALVNSSNKSILWNNNTGTHFTLAAQLKSGAAFNWDQVAGSSSWSAIAKTDAELAAVPEFAQYTWDLWFFAAGSTANALIYNANITTASAPDFSYTQRLTSRIPAVRSLQAMPWNSLETNDFLNPSSTLASSQASVNVAWTASATPVEYVSAFGQKNTAGTSGQADSFVRIVGDSSAYRVKISETSKLITPANDVAGTAALLGITGTTQPTIPNCQNAAFPVIDAISGSVYATQRSLTIRSRTNNLARTYVTNAWNNFTD